MNSLRDVEPEIRRALSKLETKTAYAEAMAERGSGHRLRLDKKAATPSPQPQLEGVVFRAWNGASWVESATSGLAPREIERAAEHLTGRLSTRTGGRPVPGPSSVATGDRTTPEKRKVSELSLEAEIEWARTVLGWATSVPGVENAFVSLTFDRNERMFLSTAGAAVSQSLQHSLASVTPLAIDGGKVEFDYVAQGITGGAEVLDGIGEVEVQHAAREAKALLGAKPAPTGSMNVVLDPSTTGTFAHESFGHGTEADQLLRGRSYLQPLLGKQLGPEYVTLVDNGAVPGGWGSIFFDDEGQAAQRTVLVDHGRFVEVLHDRESAAELHRRPTGNARRADFLSRPFVRMTNTYVEGGDHSFDELIAEAKDGVLLETFTSGIEDPLGGQMQLKVKKGRRIERGELTDRYSSMALSGKVLDFLRDIRGLSKITEIPLSPGLCGKGHTDMLPTGSGGPYLLSRAVVGPA